MSKCLSYGPTGSIACGPVTGELKKILVVDEYPLGFEGMEVPPPGRMDIAMAGVHVQPAPPMIPVDTKALDLELRISAEVISPAAAVLIGAIDAIPPEKVKAMQDYAKALRKKYPKWKPARITAKVCARFKIKLVPHADQE